MSVRVNYYLFNTEKSRYDKNNDCLCCLHLDLSFSFLSPLSDTLVLLLTAAYLSSLPRQGKASAPYRDHLPPILQY